MIGDTPTTGARVNTWFMNWLRIAGSADPAHHAPIVMNHLTGLALQFGNLGLHSGNASFHYSVAGFNNFPGSATVDTTSAAAYDVASRSHHL